MGSRSRSLLLLALSLTGCVAADKKAFITSQAEVNTECKTCPRSLCPNVVAYAQEGDLFNVTCWTRGTKIMGDDLWLKSDAGCYVTQYDVFEYEGDYSEDLAYCGKASEEQHLTTEDATLRYKTECRICPEISCDIIAYLPEETDITLTCWTDEGQIVIDDPYHLKTTNNCYVAEIGLYQKPDKTYLDNCGPIPLLEIEKHWNENGTSEVNKRDPHASPNPVPSTLGTQYLINVTVGEDVANCRSCPDEKCGIQERYTFNEEVWLQCLATGTNGTWWSETIDFCYVKNSDFWESPEGDYYRNPLCEYFEIPGDDVKSKERAPVTLDYE
ncbi:hypothetical protein P280DRAFT_394935 [Massarina eburnea CBS 473.64]|uniref:Uncharacterized protein n=1 Tax=Massarina eburnea CBS 473.64 TaxID=1395130 RepID=A0A6A6S794_9PLEO|nr:hypothetical protein P280DRAFT_394935 [Massarina eburnea CBS 473.64]